MFDRIVQDAHNSHSPERKLAMKKKTYSVLSMHVLPVLEFSIRKISADDDGKLSHFEFTSSDLKSIDLSLTQKQRYSNNL